MKRYDVFVAYAGLDEPYARELYEALAKTLGEERVFFDKAQPPGNPWYQEVPRALVDSRVTAAVLARGPSGGWYNESEFTIAIDEMRRGDHLLIPVFVNGSPEHMRDWPYGFQGLTAIDVRAHGGMISAADAIVAQLRELRVSGVPEDVALISYARRHQEWVEVFRDDLESCLKQLDEQRRVSLDTTDLMSGQSWSSRLEKGVQLAEHLILIATPESLVSSREDQEWRDFVADHPRYQNRLHVVSLVKTPLPPGLETAHRIELHRYGDKTYGQRIMRLAKKLAGRTDLRGLGESATTIRAPRKPESLPAKLRQELVEWLRPILASGLGRRGVEASLDLPKKTLEHYSSSELAASAAFAVTTGDDSLTTGALRLLGTLENEMEETLHDLEALRDLKGKLEALTDQKSKSGLITLWLKRVARDHQHLIPYQQVIGLDPLDCVYVELALSPKQRREDRDSFVEESLDIKDLLELQLKDHSGINRKWLIWGKPGAGKTTLLRQLAYSEARNPSTQWVPVFESLPSLIRQADWLPKIIESRMIRSGPGARGLEGALNHEGQHGRLLLLLDGLDEVPREKQNMTLNLLQDFSDRWPDTPILVASRPTLDLQIGGGFVELDLQPFDRDRQTQFLAQWFGRATGQPDESRAGAVFSRLGENPSLHGLMGNPLYLTFMANLDECDIPIEQSRSRLYDQIFRLLLNGGIHDQRKPMPQQKAVHGVLRLLAYEMTLENRYRESLRDLEDRLLRSPRFAELRRSLQRHGPWREGLQCFFRDLAQRTGILGPRSDFDGEWQFLHGHFREALAAEALEEFLGGEGGEAGVLRLAREVIGAESRWAEPFALLVERVSDPDTLLRALSEANYSLGLHAAASAQSLRDETIFEILEFSRPASSSKRRRTSPVDSESFRAVLERVPQRDQWKERARVYQRLPELIESPKVSLKLLEKVRRATRSGNDLFFIGQAMLSVGERWPEVQQDAEAYFQNLFDHIPVSPGENFRQIESPRGTLDLWQRIPEGRGWIGSNEKANERPSHQVTLESSFLLGVVPVTVAQYAAFDPGHISPRWPECQEEELAGHPAVRITWYQAMAFCQWLSSRVPWAKGARLPTEAEWEYACRSNTASLYSCGDERSKLGRFAWFKENSRARTHQVGDREPNSWNLHDMHGNVWEWTLSPMVCYQELGSTMDPLAVRRVDFNSTGVRRVLRGGGYWSDAGETRSAFRNRGRPGVEFDDQGFRVVIPRSSIKIPPAGDP